MDRVTAAPSAPPDRHLTRSSDDSRRTDTLCPSPPAVEAYLAAHATAAPRETADLFTDDAVVHDDGRTYRGRDEIVGWRTDVARSFTYTTTRLSAVRDDPEVAVTDRVVGDFPGGRVDLRSVFTTDPSGLISALRISVVE